VLQALDGQQLQLLIGLGARIRCLAGVLADLEFEGFCVGDPTALREALDEVLHRGQRIGLLRQLVEGVGFPVEGGVNP